MPKKGQNTKTSNVKVKENFFNRLHIRINELPISIYRKLDSS